MAAVSKQRQNRDRDTYYERKKHRDSKYNDKETQWERKRNGERAESFMKIGPRAERELWDETQLDERVTCAIDERADMAPNSYQGNGP